MTRNDFIRILTPDFLKKRKIKSLVNEYNIHVRLRNQAYDLTTPQPEIVYDSQDQSGESLDKTIDFIQKNIDLMKLDNYQEKIDSNKAHRQAKAQRLADEKEKDKLVSL